MGRQLGVLMVGGHPADAFDNAGDFNVRERVKRHFGAQGPKPADARVSPQGRRQKSG